MQGKLPVVCAVVIKAIILPFYKILSNTQCKEIKDHLVLKQQYTSLDFLTEKN